MVKENSRIRDKIPELFLELMQPHLDQVDEVISQGLTLLRWTSLDLDGYVSSVLSTLSRLELLINRVNDLLEFQINGVLNEIQEFSLCALPENEPWTVEQFLGNTKASPMLYP